MAHQEFDVNGRPARWTAFLFGVIGVQTFIIQPGIVQGIVATLGYTERQAGWVAATEMGGLALAAGILALWTDRIDWHRTLRSGALLAAAADVASAFAHDVVTFSAARFIAGFGLGALVSLSWAAVGLTRDPDRQFGWYVGWALIYGAVGIVVLPAAFSSIGMSGVMVAMGAFALFAVPFVRFMPRSAASRTAPNPDAVEISSAMKALALTGIFAFNTALGAAWAYLFLIGVAAGLAEQSIANALAVSQIAAVVGSIVVVVMGQRFGRIGPVCVGLLVSAASLAPLLGTVSLAQYTLGVCTFNFLWNIVLPYAFAAFSSYDRTGRMVVAAVALQMLGFGIGPGAAAMLMQPNDFDAVVILAMGLIGASCVMLLAAALHHRACLRSSFSR